MIRYTMSNKIKLDNKSQTKSLIAVNYLVKLMSMNFCTFFNIIFDCVLLYCIVIIYVLYFNSKCVKQFIKSLKY